MLSWNLERVLHLCVGYCVMCRTVKFILVGIYCGVFLHCLKYIILNEKQDIVDIHYIVRTPGVLKRMMREIKKRKNNTTILSMDFKRPVRFPTDLKFILKWNEVFSHPNDEYSYGQRAFIVNNCSYYNCFITNTQHFLLDIRHFDAIIFDVDSEWDKHPHFRSPHQTYIFTALDHGNNGEICLTYNYDNYFNLTWTYRLDSDIIKTPFQILNKYGTIVGPKSNMAWIDPMKPTSEDVKKIIKNKKKAVAWFLTDCHTKNSKTIGTLASYVEKLLKKRNLTLDIYGWCGNLKCPKQRIEECLVLLKKDYYFYFAFEMVLKEDYVTEEILQPLQNYAVPIVYGGANYSRFLPPGSYIDAVKLSGDEVVLLIEQAIRSPEIYQNYFRWHNHYTYRKAPKENGICSVCEILNNPSRNHSMKNFSRWWYAENYKLCQKPSVNT